MSWTTFLRRPVVVACFAGALLATGCATPRWVNATDANPDDAINGKHVGRALVVAVHAAAEYEPGPTPYELVLPRGATPETYAEVTHGLGPDALVPVGIPAVAISAATGRAERRDKAVIEAERLAPPEAAPAGSFPVYRVKALRLTGQTGELDIVRPLQSGRRMLTVGLDLDPGFGWRATGVRLWRALDPDAGL